MKNKRIVTLLLAALMLMSIFAACKNDNGDGSGTSGNGQNTTTGGNNSTDDSRVTDSLPDGLDLGEYEFVILTYQTGNTVHYFDPVESEDSVSAEAVKRNAAIEKRLNCEIVCNELTAGAGAGVHDIFYKGVNSGEQPCDVADYHTCELSYISAFLVLGGFYDYAQMEYLDFTKPYWNKNFNDTFNFGETQYIVSGSFNSTDTIPLMVWFNKKLMKDLKLELPYDIILEGDWTIDVMLDYMKGAYRDIDGEQGVTQGDQFGIADGPQHWAYLASGFGMTAVAPTDDGNISLNIYNDKLVQVVEKLNSIYWNNENSYQGNGFDSFVDGNALFCNFLSGAAAFRTIIEGFEYGCAPMPKWNDEQENYYSYTPAACLVSPSTLKHPEKTGAVLEALMAGSYYEFTDAVIGDLVENKVLLDEKDVEVYRLVIKNQYIDFARYYQFSTSLAYLGHITSFITNNNNNVSSWAGENEGKIRESYEKFREYLGLTFE